MSAANDRFFSNTDCPYFPCHPWEASIPFNCMFCYCPLYTLGPDCGGAYQYTEKGVKDCSACLLPHSPAGYDHIQKQFPKIQALMDRLRNGTDGEDRP